MNDQPEAPENHGQWILAHAHYLHRVTPWPFTRWCQALQIVARRPNRDQWLAWLYENLGCTPAMFIAAVETADAYRADYATTLEQQAAAYRKLNGLPPDAPLHIDLPQAVAGEIAEITAAEAAEWLAEQPSE